MPVLTGSRRWWAVRRSGRRCDRGGVTLIAAVLLGWSVLFGVSALVVDVGRIYVEREELQTGADAAATAVARRCLAAPTNCDTADEIRAIAADYANRNTRDGHSAVVVCGYGWALDDENCPAAPENRASCLGDPPAWPTRYVEVRTFTELADGASLLPPVFSRTFGQDGKAIAACARAMLEIPVAMDALAVTLHKCNWEFYTDGGADLPTALIALVLKGEPPSHCPQPGTPGNFGKLADRDRDCVAAIDLGVSGGWTDSETGNSFNDCEPVLQASINSGEPLPLPLWDECRPLKQGKCDGTKTAYEIVGFAGFKIVGYDLNGQPYGAAHTDLCDNGDSCLFGYFVEASFPITRGGGDIGYGAVGRAIVIG